MNRVVMGGLIATCALSSWALLSGPAGQEAHQAGGIIEPAARRIAAKPSIVSDTVAVFETPSTWPKPEMDVAVRNPFASPTPPSLKAIVQPPAPAAPQPPPPRAEYRYWGRMSSPEKHTFLFLAKGQDGTPVAIRPQTHLDDGWSVETVGDNAIVLANAATQQRTTIFVPPADAAPR